MTRHLIAKVVTFVVNRWHFSGAATVPPFSDRYNYIGYKILCYEKMLIHLFMCISVKTVVCDYV